MTIDDLVRLLGLIPSIVDRLDRQNELLGRLVAASPPQMLSVAEAAKRMGTCAATIRRMCAANELAHRRAGRRLLIDASALRPTDPAQIATLARAARGGT